MPQPTRVSFTAGTFSDNGNINETVAGISWQAGDIVVVFGGTSNNTAANQLATPTVTGGSGTGLTFTPIDSVNNDNANDGASVMMWTATAAGTGSGTIQSVTSAPSGLHNGLGVFVMRGATGLGTPVKFDNSAAKTFSLTRAQANSHVIGMLVDWNQAGDVTVTTTPAGTVEFAEAEAGQADYFILSFGDQGATGTTSYGIGSHTGTVIMSGILVEVKGTIGGGSVAAIIAYYNMLRANE